MIMNRLLLGALLACLLIGCGRTAQPTQTGNQDHIWPTLPPHIPTIEEFGYYADWQIRPSTDLSRIAITITIYHSLWFEHVTAVISTGHQIDTQLQPLAKTAIDPAVPFILELSVDRASLQPDNEITIVLNGQSSTSWINQVWMNRYLSLDNSEYVLTSGPLHQPKVEEFLEPFDLDEYQLFTNPQHQPTPTVYMMETLDPAIPTPQN